MASYGQGRVALPRCQGEPRDLADLLDTEAASYVRNFETRVMYAPEEWELLRNDLQEFVPYMDATLSSRAAKYNRFVAELASHHIVEFTQRPAPRCSVFFVIKKNKELRLICDPRSFNQRCRPPPHMPLGGAATFGRLNIPEFETAFVAAADVEAYFFRLGIPEHIGRSFCLPPVPGAVVANIRGHDFVASGGAGLPWHPYFRVLPMGFSWSFWFAQRVHQEMIRRSGVILASHILLEGAPVPSLKNCATLALPYCDNMYVISTDPARPTRRWAGSSRSSRGTPWRSTRLSLRPCWSRHWA